MKTKIKLPKDPKKVDKVKELLNEIKEDHLDEKCILRTTEEPSKDLLERLQRITNKEVEVEILDKEKYIGGAEFLCNGKLYSNLVSQELEKIRNHLKNERNKESN